VDDCKTLLTEAVRLLMGSTCKDNSDLTCGIDTDTVRSILCALLRVPTQHMSLLDNPDLKQLTIDETKAFQIAQTDAARIAGMLKKSNTTDVSYEEYTKLISKATDPKFTQQLLLAAKADDTPVQTPSGTALPVILPPPRTLTSKGALSVRLKILCVDEGSAVASVQILKSESEVDQPALVDLIGKTLPLKFDGNMHALRNLLIGMQLVEKSISCKVSVERALRSVDNKFTALKLIRCLSTDLEQKEVRDGLAQIDLDFGSTEAKPLRLA
jgi:hypothetical protein